MWEDILSGPSYIPTHQGIGLVGKTLSDPVRILDGQHRLMAIENTGIAAEFNVSFGCDPASFTGIDSGIGRSMKDRTHLNAKEIQICNVVAKLGGYFLSSRITGAGTQAIHDEISPWLDMPSMGYTTLGVSVASIRAAFVCHYARGGSPDAYHTFVTGDFQRMTTSMLHLYRKQSRIATRVDSHIPSELFWMCVRCLESPELKRVSVDPDCLNKSREYIRDTFDLETSCAFKLEA